MVRDGGREVALPYKCRSRASPEIHFGGNAVFRSELPADGGTDKAQALPSAMQPVVNAPRDLLDVVQFLQQIAGKNERVGLLQG